MKYHETPNYVCKIMSSSPLANLLAHLDESDLKVHYQSQSLITFLDIPVHFRHIKLFDIFQESMFDQDLRALCIFCPHPGEFFLPGVHSDLTLPWRPVHKSLPRWSSPNQSLSSTQAVSFYYFVHHILSSLIRMSALGVGWGDKKHPSVELGRKCE